MSDQAAWHDTFFSRSSNRHLRNSHDFLFLPYLDYCMAAFAFLPRYFRRMPWFGVTMRQQFHFPHQGVIAPRRPVHDALQQLALRNCLSDPNCLALCSNDPSLVRHVRNRKLSFLPDPVLSIDTVDRPTARSRFGIPPGHTVILIFGNICLRKGVHRLINAALSPAWLDSWTILCIGQWDADCHEEVSEAVVLRLIACNRLKLLRCHASADDESLAYQACDIVWLAYESFYTASSAQTQAMNLGLPVITSGNGVIHWLSEQLHQGVATDASPTGVCAAISALTASRPGTAKRVRTNFDARFQSCCSFLAQRCP